MALRQTALRGWGYPITTRSLKKLSSLMVRIRSYALSDFQAISKLAGDYRYDRLLYFPSTDDGYRWFAGLKFEVQDGFFAILIPWALTGLPGEKWDRPFAIYCQGKPSSRAIELVVSKLTAEMKKYFDPRRASKAV